MRISTLLRKFHRAYGCKLRRPFTVALLLVIGLSSARGHAQDAVVDRPSQAASIPLVRLYAVGSPTEGDAHFLVVHGLGGTQPNDRFHRLAQTIKRSLPAANVAILDWSEPASAKFGPVPLPWKVAGQIDVVAEEGAKLLAEARFDAARATLIGESFGNYVNAQLAARLGGVERILAFNPASEAGGYLPPNLRTRARQAWSFHTYSVFDTAREIAHADFFLETPAGANDLQQHVAGIGWLTVRVEEGDRSWLTLDKQVPAPITGAFRAKALLDGNLSLEPVPRTRLSQGAATQTDAQAPSLEQSILGS